jgi:hypothetical protein
MDYQAHAKELLREWALCLNAKPKNNVVDIQINKDALAPWAAHLIHQMNWGSESELAEACHQLESRLKQLKEQLVIEVIKHGTV